MAFVQSLFSTYEALVKSAKLLGSRAGNSLFVEDRRDAIARSKLTGGRQAQIEGLQTNIPNGSTDVSQLGVANIPIPPLTGISMEIVSTSVNDTDVTGSNAWKVIIEYINPTDLTLKAVEYSLNGTTAVTITESIGFVSDFYVSSTNGLQTKNEGIISIRGAGGGTVYNIIAAGVNKSLCPMRYVPIDKNLYITVINFSGDTKGVALRLEATQSDNLTNLDTFVCRSGAIMSDAPSSLVFDPPIVITGGNYIKAVVVSDSANSGTVGVCFNGWLENK